MAELYQTFVVLSGEDKDALVISGGGLNYENQVDQFTLKESDGGTAEYGNNALDYPIALINYKEAFLTGINSSNNNPNNFMVSAGANYWTISGTYIWGRTSSSCLYKWNRRTFLDSYATFRRERSKTCGFTI